MFELPALDYKYSELEPYIDAQTMELHHTKHHQTYIDKLNSAIKDTDAENKSLEEIIKNISNYSTFIRNQWWWVYNHNLFWKFISPNGWWYPPENLFKHIENIFWSFEDFKQQFETQAVSLFGSWWTWLIINNEGQLEILNTQNQDNPIMDVLPKQGKPILGIDMREHAYYLKYQNRKAEYVQSFWNLINWKYVDTLYKEYSQ